MMASGGMMTEREQFEALPRDLKLFVVLMLGIDNHDEAKALLVQIIQAARAAPARDQEALMALNIARYMQERFYPEAKDFEPLNDLMGLLTQISNMATGLARAAPAQPAGERFLVKRRSEREKWERSMHDSPDTLSAWDRQENEYAWATIEREP